MSTTAKLKAFLSDILRTYLPMDCPVCGKKPFDGSANMFCSECVEGFRFVKPPYCPGCGGELSGILAVCPDCLKAEKRPWKKAYSVFRMDGTVKDIIHMYKYRNRPELARALGRLAAGRLADEDFKADIIVPTPLHWTRMMYRGFNQAELVSEEISKHLKFPVKNILRRKRRTKQQARLNKAERMANLHDAFSVIDSTRCKNRAILLVDDVMTTGSTLSAAAEALLASGAAEVNVLVVARRQRD